MTSSPPTTLDHAIATAVHAGVRTILVHDASPEVFASIAARLTAEVGARFGTPRTVRLGGREDDGALFGDWAPRGDGALDLAWRPGALEPPPDGELIVTLTDLSHADRDLRRALLATTSGGPVYVERNGQQRVWTPRLWWLVGCPFDRVGAVTPHLIDRFAVRLRAESQSIPSIESLRRFIEDDSPLAAASPLPAPLYAPTQLRSSIAPTITDDALDRALTLVSGGPTAAPDLRRALALVRLAAADVTLRLTRASREAASRGADLATSQSGETLVDAAAARDAAPTVDATATVDAAAIDRCAAAFDLALRAPAPLSSPAQTPSPPPPVDPDLAGRLAGDLPRRPRPDRGTGPRAPVAPSSAPPRPAPTNETTTAIDDARDPTGASRYAEDAAPVLRDPETLRISFGARMAPQRGRGRILGSEPADTLSDLSLVDTMLAAARRRCFEAKHAGSPELPALRIKPADLRRRRRAPAPGDLLVVVLDHTSLDWSWGNALSRYLREAYVRRSAVALIQVGATATPAAPTAPITADELRARSLHIRNVRSKALYDALTPRPGRATPLAHGLALAADAIRAAATRGRSHAARIRLVVVSDGRGNVRLSDSQAGTLTLPTRTEGVRDALDVAAQIRTLRGVESVVLHRRDEIHADLPIQLARTLGGKAQSLRTGGRG
jgi:magnesium chelatase subunit D